MRTSCIDRTIKRINIASYELKATDGVLVEVQDLVDLKLYIEELESKIKMKDIYIDKCEKEIRRLVGKLCNLDSKEPVKLNMIV